MKRNSIALKKVLKFLSDEGIDVIFFKARHYNSRRRANLVVGSAQSECFWTGMTIACDEGQIDKDTPWKLLHEYGHLLASTRNQQSKVNFGIDFEGQNQPHETRACGFHCALMVKLRLWTRKQAIDHAVSCLNFERHHANKVFDRAMRKLNETV